MPAGSNPHPRLPQRIGEHISDSELFKKSKKNIFQVLFGRSIMIAALLAAQIVVFILLFWRARTLLLPLFSGYFGITAVMLVYLINTESSPNMKLSWSLLIAIVPIMGIPLYLYIRNDVGARILKKLVYRSKEHGDKYLPESNPMLLSSLDREPELKSISRYLWTAGRFCAYTNTQTAYYPLGEEMYAGMLEAVKNAEHFIFMEYFHIIRSQMWTQLLEILLEKAAQGVEIRILYDGTCDIALLPHSYPQQLEKYGIQCRIFSPIYPVLTSSYNSRDHRKILVVDGKIGFTGGINLDDPYVNITHPFGHWKDVGVRLEGAAVDGLTRLFLNMWDLFGPETEYKHYLSQTQAEVIDPKKGWVIPYGVNPTGRERIGEMVYLDLINRAQHELLIMTPYLILDNEMVSALRFAAKRGVDVRIILPHIPDKRYAFALARSHYKELSAAGVKLFEYTPGFVHAKVFLADGFRGVVGTVNLDYRSLYLHFEDAVYLHKTPCLKDIRADFLDTLQKSQAVTEQSILALPLSTRIAGFILKPFAPLM